jgi:hypothetical protein
LRLPIFASLCFYGRNDAIDIPRRSRRKKRLSYYAPSFAYDWQYGRSQRKGMFVTA